MKIMIEGKSIRIDTQIQEVARQDLEAFMKNIKEKANKYNQPALYLVTLLLMYVKSQQLIETITPELLETAIRLCASDTDEP